MIRSTSAHMVAQQGSVSLWNSVVTSNSWKELPMMTCASVSDAPGRDAAGVEHDAWPAAGAAGAIVRLSDRDTAGQQAPCSRVLRQLVLRHGADEQCHPLPCTAWVTCDEDTPDTRRLGTEIHEKTEPTAAVASHTAAWRWMLGLAVGSALVLMVYLRSSKLLHPLRCKTWDPQR